MIDSFGDVLNSNNKCLKDYVTFEDQYYWWYDETAIHVDFSHNDIRGYNLFKSIQLYVIKICPSLLLIIYFLLYVALMIIDKVYSKPSQNRKVTDTILLARSHSGRWEYKYDEILEKKHIESRDYAEIENIEKGGPIAIADYYMENNDDMKKLKESSKRFFESMEKML